MRALAHVRRAFNVIRGVSRGLTQDLAAAKTMQDSFVALRSRRRGILESAFSAAGDWAAARDIRGRFADRRMTEARRALVDRAVTSARIRRGAMLGAAGLWGLSQVSDLADRAFNPRRSFMMDPTNTRVDIPIIPFI